MRAGLEILTARMEEVDEKQEDAIFRESQSVEGVLIDERDVDMLDKLTEADYNSAEGDWMGEFIRRIRWPYVHSDSFFALQVLAFILFLSSLKTLFKLI